MDIATLIGLIASLGLVAVTILAGEGASTFMNLPSLLIVVGGTIGATLVSFPISTVMQVMGVVRKTLFVAEPNSARLIEALEDLAKKAIVYSEDALKQSKYGATYEGAEERHELIEEIEGDEGLLEDAPQ